MKNEINKAAVYNAFVSEIENNYNNLKSEVDTALEETLEKPKHVMDTNTTELLDAREINFRGLNRITTQLKQAKEFSHATKNYSIVQHGAIMVYKNGAEDAPYEGIFFGPFTGTVEVEGIKIKGMGWNSLVQKKFKGKQEGSTFTLPNGTYTVQKVI